MSTVFNTAGSVLHAGFLYTDCVHYTIAVYHHPGIEFAKQQAPKGGPLVQWGMCSTVGNVFYSGECVLQWGMCSTVGNVFYSGERVLQWGTCSTVGNVFYSGECTLQGKGHE